ncbi:MAG: GxxExxY protein [Methylobacter sp.]
MHTDKLKYKELTHLILKGFYDVYNELGGGFLESVYENAMALVLQQQGLQVETQKDIAVYFRGTLIGSFRADMIIEEKILLELKAVRCLKPVHEAQLLNYLKATRIELGLLMNFGDEPTFKRLVYNKAVEPRMNTDLHR